MLVAQSCSGIPALNAPIQISKLCFPQAFLPLLRKAAQLGTGMGCHRAAIINMSSLAASMQLVQANEMFLKVYPYRIAKVCGLLADLSTSVDTKNVLVLHVGGNGSCGTLHLEQLWENRLPNPCSDPLLRDLAFREELMP